MKNLMGLFKYVNASVISEESHGRVNIAYIIIYGESFLQTLQVILSWSVDINMFYTILYKGQDVLGFFKFSEKKDSAFLELKVTNQLCTHVYTWERSDFNIAAEFIESKI